MEIKVQYDSVIEKELLEISDSLIKEPDYLKSVIKIIELAGHTCSAEGGFFYTLVDDKFLNLEYSYNEKLKLSKIGSDNNIYAQSIFIPESRFSVCIASWGRLTAISSMLCMSLWKSQF